MQSTEIKITAQPESNNQRCKFTVDRTVYEGRLSIKDKAIADNAPLARRIFDLGGVARVDFAGPVVVVTQDGTADWGKLARAVGAAIRTHLQANEPIVKPGWKPELTPAEILRDKVQTVLDNEINPAVAGHGGYVEITDVQDTRIFVKMGGGCQGCSSASATLREGVERMILERVPEVTAILDSTDHTAGVNPYYR